MILSHVPLGTVLDGAKHFRWLGVKGWGPPKKPIAVQFHIGQTSVIPFQHSEDWTNKCDAFASRLNCLETHRWTIPNFFLIAD